MCMCVCLHRLRERGWCPCRFVSPFPLPSPSFAVLCAENSLSSFSAGGRLTCSSQPPRSFFSLLLFVFIFPAVSHPIRLSFCFLILVRLCMSSDGTLLHSRGDCSQRHSCGGAVDFLWLSFCCVCDLLSVYVHRSSSSSSTAANALTKRSHCYRAATVAEKKMTNACVVVRRCRLLCAVALPRIAVPRVRCICRRR